MIWWLWTAYPSGHPSYVHVYDLVANWKNEEPDVAWLGEAAWTARVDNAGIGLR